jgi:hypothetical protein
MHLSRRVDLFSGLGVEAQAPRRLVSRAIGDCPARGVCLYAPVVAVTCTLNRLRDHRGRICRNVPAMAYGGREEIRRESSPARCGWLLRSLVAGSHPRLHRRSQRIEQPHEFRSTSCGAGTLPVGLQANPVRAGIGSDARLATQPVPDKPTIRLAMENARRGRTFLAGGRPCIRTRHEFRPASALPSTGACTLSRGA